MQARGSTGAPAQVVGKSESKLEQRPPSNCPRCGEAGHWASDCPSKLSQEKKHQPRCYTCNQKEHLSFQCPTKTSLYCDRGSTGSLGGGDSTQVCKKGSINGVPCKILLDTETNQSLVHSDFVTKEDIIDEHTTIRCMHGDEVTYPLAVVKVGIGGKDVIMNAAVSNTLPRAALLRRLGYARVAISH